MFCKNIPQLLSQQPFPLRSLQKPSTGLAPEQTIDPFLRSKRTQNISISQNVNFFGKNS